MKKKFPKIKLLTPKMILVLAPIFWTPQLLAQSSNPGNSSQNCNAKKNGSNDCTPIVKKSNGRRNDYGAPNRKPPKPPQQISPVKDELPDRREDDF
jgi:hypothetical protein